MMEAEDAVDVKGIQQALTGLDNASLSKIRDAINDLKTNTDAATKKVTELGEEPGLTKGALFDLLERLGSKLEFDVKTEVEASDSAFVDIVWFDKRLPVGKKSFNLRYEPVLPVIGFEVEWGTALNAKHVKGSVSNLSNLSAQLSIIVVAKHNLESLGNQPAHRKDSPGKLRMILTDRMYRWVYAEAQAKGRIIVMFEEEVKKWAKTKGLLPDPSLVDALPSPAVPPAAFL